MALIFKNSRDMIASNRAVGKGEALPAERLLSLFPRKRANGGRSGNIRAARHFVCFFLKCPVQIAEPSCMQPLEIFYPIDRKRKIIELPQFSPWKVGSEHQYKSCCIVVRFFG
ncbi:hypothetical protein [uncultured Cohaesibacter sp.]|uniref:hypothetical protein n=1 Tax=uncultured Cohaesibacter sp. TaxID=1002546 RepID=UPI0029C6102E|nr:hypothetical protein [uncultured Cohaesibacter sp.]